MIETLHLFEELGLGLHELLSSLTPDEWRRPTVHRDRDVKDLASHLLDTAQRRLASQRDGWFGDEKPRSFDWDGLVEFIQHMNRGWMDVTRRLSPRQLVDQLARADAELVDFLRTLAPHARALYPVAWAGEEVSENWFDVAREYTERWHHQQQIRDAVGAPALDEPFFLAPALGAFVHALPQTFRTSEAPAGTTVALVIDGPGGGSWCVRRDPDDWRLYQGAPPNPDAQVTLGQNPAWQLFTRVIAPADARAQATLAGDQQLGLRLLDTIAVIA